MAHSFCRGDEKVPSLTQRVGQPDVETISRLVIEIDGQVAAKNDVKRPEGSERILQVLLLEAIEIIPITEKAKESIASVKEWKK